MVMKKNYSLKVIVVLYFDKLFMRNRSKLVRFLIFDDYEINK